MDKYIIALDEGTTSARACLVNAQGHICGFERKAIRQIYPQPGWVEQDAYEVWNAQITALNALCARFQLSVNQIAGIALTNQRETTVVWDKRTGKPLCNAIVWQCRRSSAIIDAVCGDPLVAHNVQMCTGLIPDAYFSAGKIRWILDSVPQARTLAEQGHLAFGTIDSWILWNLTKGACHVTDPTNACRTMLYNITEQCWDSAMLQLFDIPHSLLPDVVPSSGEICTITCDCAALGARVCACVGDQQAALFGQCCFEKQQAKTTYGTGCFLLMHTGNKPYFSSSGLLTTLAALPYGTREAQYVLEGSAFMGGALITWLHDALGIVKDARDANAIARACPSTEGVVVVPAFTGLGAPYWDAQARGAIVGITRGTRAAHIVRATLDSIAYQVYDLIDAMQIDCGMSIKGMNVDGGVCASDVLMQFQSDVLGKPLRRSHNLESSVLGAAYLAGLSTGFFDSLDTLRSFHETDTFFMPNASREYAQGLIAQWHHAVACVRHHH